ncbi:MAG: type II secretion system protein GspK [Planctomycetales bacterium]
MRQFHQIRCGSHGTPRREGSVLVIVLVIVALLSLGAYSFSEFMLIEAESSDFHTRAAQSREAADSGVEMVASYLADRAARTPSASYSNSDLFYHQALASANAANAHDFGRFSIVSPVLTDTTFQSVRFGLRDESSKINVNQLPSMGMDETQARQFLMGIPNMTTEIADAILDWVDTDSQPRQNGAEQSAYNNANPPITVRNGPMQSLDEMLSIQGITPELFFGEDLNRNGILDPNENDGNAQPPNDNADGILQRGFVDYFTIYSRESNLKSDNTAKININDTDLGNLFNAVQTAYGADAAKFVIAFRTAGPPQQSTSTTGNSGAGGNRSGGGTGSTGSSTSGSGGSSGGRRGSGGGGTGGSTGGSSRSGGSSGSGGSSAGGASGAEQPELVGGIDISGGGRFKVKSLYELLGIQISVRIDGKQTTLTSPWPKEPGEMMSFLPKLFDTFAIDSQPVRNGRININQAPAEVMMYIPGIDQQVVQAIVAAQSATGDVSPDRLTNGWLVVRGLVPLERMIQLDPFVTGQGDVYRFQVVGYHDRGGPMTRIEAVLDASGVNPKVLMFQDLTRLGSGYSRAQLGLTAPQ